MMRETLLISATFLAAVVMGQALAHALELPGKMRLNREQYYTDQTIYYPGFTFGGMAEPLSILVTGAALLTTPAVAGVTQPTRPQSAGGAAVQFATVLGLPPTSS